MRRTTLLLGDRVSGDVEELERALQTRLVEAREAWPGVEIPDELFLPFLATHLPTALPVFDALEATHVGHLYLAQGCLLGQRLALEALDQNFLRPLVKHIVRAGFPLPNAQEACQRLAMKLLVRDQGKTPRIAQFTGRSDLTAWLRVGGLREAMQSARGVVPKVSIEDVTLELEASGDDPELKLMKETYRQEFGGAFVRALAELTPRERTLLKQYLIDDLTIDQLGALYGVHRATAARWVAHARGELVSRTKVQLMKTLGIGAAEASRIVRLIRSGLNLSVRRHLGGEPSL
jgi:RNA polymerase sigma-70 factor (ECF subfamily)